MFNIPDIILQKKNFMSSVIKDITIVELPEIRILEPLTATGLSVGSIHYLMIKRSMYFALSL